VFSDLLGLPSEAPLPSEPRQKRELILSALVGQLEGLAEPQPVLLVFEDAHWIDSQRQVGGSSPLGHRASSKNTALTIAPQTTNIFSTLVAPTRAISKR
jgi:hypothetical protein